jgi:hypothetical protein
VNDQAVVGSDRPAELDPVTVERARIVLHDIGEEFVRLRKESRAGAWSSLQERLMKHIDLIVPYACSLKDFLSISSNIEEFLRTEQGTKADPMEALQQWLNVPAVPRRDNPVDVSDNGVIQ